MKKYQKLLALLLALVMVLALAACGNNGGNNGGDKEEGGKDVNIGLPPGVGVNNGKDEQGGETPTETPEAYVQTKVAPLMRVAVSDVPTNITPWAGTSAGRQLTLLTNVYQAVIEGIQGSEDIRMIMCHKIDRSYEKTEKGEMHRIYLYDNIYDQAGNHFTAEDAVFCIQSCVAEGAIPAMAFIGESKVVDEYTFDIEILSENRSQLAASLSNVYMVTRAAYEASADGMASAIVSTGPYCLTEWVPGTSAVLTRNENYWGADMAERSDDLHSAWMWHAQNVERVEYTKISEPAQAAIALETNVVDGAWLLTVDEASRFSGVDGYQVFATYDTLTMNCYFNCTENSPFSDVRLRQAAAYAIDRDMIIEANGGYGLLTYTFGSHLFADYVDDWDNNEYYAYNPEKAKELIAEAGYDTSREIVILVSSSTKPRQTTAQVVQAQLMAVGFNVRIDVLDAASFSANRFDPTIQDIRIDQQAFENLSNLWNQHLNYNVSGHSKLLQKDETLQELVLKVQKPEFHTPEYMTETHNYIMENCFIYSLFGITNFDAVNSNVVAAPGGRNNRSYTPIGSLTYYA